MEQYGFFFDQSRCFGCGTCAIACKSGHALPPGPLKYLRVYQYEKGRFPDIRIHYHWIPCYHCGTAVCADACPEQAIRKEPKYGAVLIDGEKCNGCRICYDVCPYGAPVFESDDTSAKAQKCDMCYDRLETGEQPVCVLSCPTRALDFAPLSLIRQRYGERAELDDLPGSGATNPSVVFKPHGAKRRLVPYQVDKAAQLLMRRDPLPPVFASAKDLTDVPGGLVGREELVVKHRSADELMRRTRNDEG